LLRIHSPSILVTLYYSRSSCSEFREREDCRLLSRETAALVCSRVDNKGSDGNASPSLLRHILKLEGQNKRKRIQTGQSEKMQRISHTNQRKQKQNLVV
jgi:hypothetical protein